MPNRKICIIGGGNMGAAIAIGLASDGGCLPQDITVIDTNPAVEAKIHAIEPKIRVVTADYSPVTEAEIVIFAVKPWLMQQVIESVKPLLNLQTQLLISIAAGVSLATLHAATDNRARWFRLVPNTAIAQKQSMTFICTDTNETEARDTVDALFASLGKTLFIPEQTVPAATALSSCGIAYAFRYVRAAMQGAVEMGISPSDAQQIIVQTLLGASALLQCEGSHPETEIDKVTTPGGITIKGLNEMENAGFSAAVVRGLKASCIQ